MNTLEILQACRKLISSPENWTQGYLARNASGYSTSESGTDARCWCSMGALYKVCDDSDASCESDNVRKILENTIKAIAGNEYPVVDYNDNHTHAEVLALWDAAIENARLKGD